MASYATLGCSIEVTLFFLFIPSSINIQDALSCFSSNLGIKRTFLRHKIMLPSVT
jgi:hypothetical protein